MGNEGVKRVQRDNGWYMEKKRGNGLLVFIFRMTSEKKRKRGVGLTLRCQQEGVRRHRMISTQGGGPPANL